MKIIEVKDVSFEYSEDIKALDKVSFEIEKGSYTCILGHNGSGKSTMAKLMAGLLPLKTGEIKVDGKNLIEDNLGEIRRELGIVFQNPDNQFIGSTVRDDIAFGLENYCFEPKDMDDIIMKFSKIVDMDKYLESEPTNLSGGQKQRVAIAGVLAMGPSIIIFDEATSMLDPSGKAEIKKIINELHKEKELTIISITHDIEEALNSDELIVLNEGKVLFNDKPENIFNKHEKELIEIGLDIPFSYKVKNAFKAKGYDIKARNDMEGLVEEICQLNLKR